MKRKFQIDESEDKIWDIMQAETELRHLKMV